MDICPLPVERAIALAEHAWKLPYVDDTFLERTIDRLEQLAAHDPYRGHPADSIVHGDLHFANLLWNDGDIVAALDFEWVRFGSVDQDFEPLLRSVDWARAGDPDLVPTAGMTQILGWLAAEQLVPDPPSIDCHVSSPVPPTSVPSSPGPLIRDASMSAPSGRMILMGLDYLAELDRVTTAMASTLAEASGAEPVATCPGWTVADLADHLGRVHRWAGSIALSGVRQVMPEPKRAAPLAQWYADVAVALRAALAAVDPDEPCWNFSGLSQHAGFWRRRQVHETQVHLVDLALALGRETDIEPELAADGVDEVLAMFLHRLAGRGRQPVVDGPIVVRCTDIDRQWELRPSPEPGGGPAVSRPTPADEATAEAAMSASAVDLYLGLWGRRPHAALDVRGEVAHRFLDGPLTP